VAWTGGFRQTQQLTVRPIPKRCGPTVMGVIAMIFEFSLDPDDPAAGQEYADESARMRELAPEVDGFLGIERFADEQQPGRYVAIGYFRDEVAVTAWRNTSAHRRAQTLGRRRWFTDYRLVMAKVIRDYGPHDRGQAPSDSRRAHG
jgi:heme-degrading monooxygenase HmoA